MSSSHSTETSGASLPDNDKRTFSASPTGASDHQSSSHRTLPPDKLSNLVKDVYSIYQIPPNSEDWPKRMSSFSEALWRYDLHNEFARQLENNVLATQPSLSDEERMMRVIDDIEGSFKSHSSWDDEMARSFDELRSNFIGEITATKEKRAEIERETVQPGDGDGVDPNMDFFQRLCDLFDDHELSTPGSVSDLCSRSSVVAVSAAGLAIAAYLVSHRN